MKNVRKLTIAVFLLCVSAASLGLGLSVGYAAIGHFLVAEIPQEPTPQPAVMSTVRLNSLVMPINPHEVGFVDIIPQVKDAVVSISVTTLINRPTGRVEAPGAGSGFIFAQDEHHVFIATNNHVIEGAHTIAISLDDNENISASVVGFDASADIAVLAASRDELLSLGIPFSVAYFGDSAAMRMGDGVVAIGNAMGEGQVVTQGIVSATNLTITIDDTHRRTPLELKVMQTDAAVNRGNSGGPLINQRGEVIGIVVAKILGADVEGMGYALPSNNVTEIIMRIKQGGIMYLPYTGLVYDQMSETASRLFNLPAAGIFVLDVLEGSPAERAGFMQNDLIVSLDGADTFTITTFHEVLHNFASGDSIDFGVYRRGEKITITMTLGRSTG